MTRTVKSSIHIDAAKISYLAHNTRTTHTTNSIFDDEKNYYSTTFKEAVTLYRKELKKRTEAYTARTKQKLQKKSITLLSAIVNLEQRHTEQDLQKIVNYLEQTLDTKVVNLAIHRDEGHVDCINGEIKKNYHAHITFLGLDSEGASIRKKLTKKYLINLQDETAKLLDMKRGTNYTKERKPRPKRLDTYEYKAHAKKKEPLLKEAVYVARELQQENKKLRKELQERGATRAEYAQLEQIVRELKADIKNKDTNIDTLKNRIWNLENELQTKISDLDKAEVKLEQKNAQIANLEQKMSGKSEKRAKNEHFIENEQKIKEAIKDTFVVQELEKNCYLKDNLIVDTTIDVREMFEEPVIAKDEETLSFVQRIWKDAIGMTKEVINLVSAIKHVFENSEKETLEEAQEQYKKVLFYLTEKDREEHEQLLQQSYAEEEENEEDNDYYNHLRPW